MSAVLPSVPAPWPPAIMPISDDEIEVGFAAILADVTDVLLKNPYSEIVQKASAAVLLLSAAILCICFGIVKPEGLSLSIVTFKVEGLKILLLVLVTALLYLVWSLHARADSEISLYVYKQTGAVLKLNYLLSQIGSEIATRKAVGTLKEFGALRQKSDFISDLLPKIAQSPRLAQRMAVTYPAVFAAISIVYSAWYVVTK